MAAHLQHRPHDFGRAGAQVQPERGHRWRCSASSSSWARSWRSWCCILKNCGRSAATTGPRDSRPGKAHPLACAAPVAENHCCPPARRRAGPAAGRLDGTRIFTTASSWRSCSSSTASRLSSIERRPRVPATTKLSRITYKQAIIVGDMAGAWRSSPARPAAARPSLAACSAA